MKCTKEFLDSIDPKKNGDKYSVNIRKYLAKYKGSELPNVYKVASELNEIVGTNSFIVGDYDTQTRWMHGKRLLKVMGNHRTQCYAYTPNSFPYVELLEDFWETYKKIGRCAVDVHHRINMMNDESRFLVEGDFKKCTWCNDFVLKREIRVREYEVWEKVVSV